MVSARHFDILPLRARIPAQVYDQQPIPLSTLNIGRAAEFERLLKRSKLFQHQHCVIRASNITGGGNKKTTVHSRKRSAPPFLTVRKLVHRLALQFSTSSQKAIRHARIFQQQLLKDRSSSQQQSLNEFGVTKLYIAGARCLLIDPAAQGFLFVTEQISPKISLDLQSAAGWPYIMNAQEEAVPSEASAQDANNHEVLSPNSVETEPPVLLLGKPAAQEGHLEDITRWKQKAAAAAATVAVAVLEAGSRLLPGTLEDVEDFRLPMAEESKEGDWHLNFLKK